MALSLNKKPYEGTGKLSLEQFMVLSLLTTEIEFMSSFLSGSCFLEPICFDLKMINVSMSYRFSLFRWNRDSV